MSNNFVICAILVIFVYENQITIINAYLTKEDLVRESTVFLDPTQEVKKFTYQLNNSNIWGGPKMISVTKPTNLEAKEFIEKNFNIKLENELVCGNSSYSYSFTKKNTLMTTRQKVKFRRFFKPIISLVYEKKKLTHKQRTVFNLTKQFIVDKESKLMIGPLSSSRFIKYKNVLIKICQGKIIIYQFNSKIDEEFSYETTEELIKLFDLTAENELIILESQFLTPVINELKTLQK